MAEVTEVVEVVMEVVVVVVIKQQRVMGELSSLFYCLK
jgi:hypothetical protein